MDHDALRQTYDAMTEQHCVFEKSILTAQCGCSQAERFCIAEREGVRCETSAARAACAAWLEVSRQQARFALKTRDPRALLPHLQTLRLQLGGLRGLQSLLHPERAASTRIDDIHGLLQTALRVHGAFERLPFAPILREIAAFKFRRRARRAMHDPPAPTRPGR